MEFHHVSILLSECIEALQIKPDGIYVDATLGGGGHSEEIAKRLENSGRLIGIDKDEEALCAAQKRLLRYQEHITLIKNDFRYLNDVFSEAKIEKADGILFDLGVSSYQLDEKSRGFSYMADAPLDMRMDKTQRKTAYDVVNTYSKDELKRILFHYGEERYAMRIADAIVTARQEQEIKTTFELVELIKSAMPAPALREKQHPAKRSFQAIRIAVNDELGAVEEAINTAISLLNKGGRLAVISFHSLEDRIVKTTFVNRAKGCECPKEFPVCICGKKPEIKILTKHPIEPDDEEIMKNPRARSAKLRVCEKIEGI